MFLRFAAMRIELSHRHERFGAVRIHELTQIVEIDSGIHDGPDDATWPPRGVAHVSRRALHEVEQSLGIVIPVKNERRKVIEGVMSGIPHDCPVIVVSASERRPIDRHRLETELLGDFCAITGRRAAYVHQFDDTLTTAVTAAGYAETVTDGRVRQGKGEAMILGMLMAEVFGCSAVGFIDADNYVPGAVHEYAKSFAAGLHLAPTPYAMVRISWQSKPKVDDGRLVFNRWGRSSRTINRFLNLILSTYTGFGTEIIVTGNSGEHAMTMDLARRLRFAGGFAVEPFEIVEMFEQFGGAFPPSFPEVNESMIDIFQVETRNPHLHEDKGDDHVDGMRLEGLDAMAASKICPAPVLDEIHECLREIAGSANARPPVPVYRPLIDADVDAFAGLLSKADSFSSWGD